MTSIKKRLVWLDKHILELIAGFLLAFLPLYPKWPLFDALPGYIVRVRLEDFVIALALLIFLIQVARGKAKLRQNPLFWPIIAYLVIGLLSVLSALFITQTVPLEGIHVGKLLLHWFRRIEYMSLAFIFFAAITSKESIKRILIIFFISASLVSLYGLGQKYYQFPVYSTMNREFSKGWRLVLTEHARVSSTFGGHYDLAAYTVMGLSLITAIFLGLKGKLRYILLVVYSLVFATLLLTVSRSSFLAFAAAMGIVSLLLLRQVGFKRMSLLWIPIMLISLVNLRFFGTDIYDRFAHILMLDGFEKIVTNRIIEPFWPEREPTYVVDIPDDLSLVATDTDSPPRPAVTPKPTSRPGTNDGGGSGVPHDVYEDIPVTLPEASLSGIPDTSGTGTEGTSRTYSDAAKNFGLSSAIRLDALWPRALAAFKRNPLLGTGYSTLVKEQVSDFTEAESTDNEYLRTIGETGLLGFLSFFGIFVYALYRSFIYMQKTDDPLLRAFLAGFMGGIIGLMVNALLIDVFVSSKVAYTVWAFMGIVFGLFSVVEPKSHNPHKAKDKR